MTQPLLSLRNMTRRFGGIAAVSDVSLDLRPGIVTALVGPNGAGKTTLFNLVTGNLRVDGGKVEHAGHDITGMKPHRVAQRGIARSFQDLRLFSHMTVRENVLAATETGSWFWQQGRGVDRLARVEAALATTSLNAMSEVRAITLGYAAQKFLSMARIIASGAQIWLLDEPASGLDPSSRQQFVKLLRDATASGIAVCLIEHNLDIVIELADRIVFLDQGKVLAEGEPQQILNDPALTAIYFGDRPQ